MRVVILTQYYKPEPLPEAHELAEGLRSRGHFVTVITGFPNYPAGRVFDGYRIRPWTRETIEDVTVIRLALYPDHSTSVLRRILNYASFAVMASIAGPAFCREGDVMFVFHPPLTIGVAAYAIATACRIPYVYGVADLWPEAIVASGMLRRSVLVRLLERLERFVYRHAAAVAPVTPAMVDHIAGKGVPRHKLHVLPFWADERIYYPVPPDPILTERLGLAGSFNVVFAGQLGLVQRLGTVIEAAELLRGQNEIQFAIVGDGVDRDRLVQEATARGLTNIRFIPRVPPREMRQIYALADVLLVHLSADPVFRMSVPAKIYSYMACEKPILAAMDGAAAELIQKAGAGLACKPEDPSALASAIAQFYATPLWQRKEMGRRARDAFLHYYSRAVVLARCEELLMNIARRSDTTGTVSRTGIPARR